MSETDRKLNNVLQEIIAGLVNKGINDHFQEYKPTIIFESIEDYNTKTGKRFRMTKTQKEQGLTREEAFKDSFGKDDNI